MGHVERLLDKKLTVQALYDASEDFLSHRREVKEGMGENYALLFDKAMALFREGMEPQRAQGEYFVSMQGKNVTSGRRPPQTLRELHTLLYKAIPYQALAEYNSHARAHGREEENSDVLVTLQDALGGAYQAAERAMLDKGPAR